MELHCFILLIVHKKKLLFLIFASYVTLGIFLTSKSIKYIVYKIRLIVPPLESHYLKFIWMRQ